MNSTASVSSFLHSAPRTPTHAPPDLQHRVFLLTWDDALHRATLPSDPRNVLDLGCGTGVWSTSFAASHPHTSVVGADISPPTPTASLPNCRFVAAQAEHDWSGIEAHAAQSDFIHARLLTLGVKDWDALLTRCFRHLRPGGLLELVDVCRPRMASKAGYSADDCAVIRHADLVVEGTRRTGVDWNAHLNHGGRLEKAGFAVQDRWMGQWPLGEWPDTEKEREIGRLTLENADGLLESSPQRLARAFPDMGIEAAEGLRDAARRELREKSHELKLYTAV